MSDSGSDTGGASSSSWQEMAEEVYAAVSTGDPHDKARAIAALRATGNSEEEAETAYATAARMAQGAGSREAFLAVLKGDVETPADLSDEEVEVFGMAWGRAAGGAGSAGAAGMSGIGAPGAPGASGGSAIRGGRTWEGSGGNTWQGSSRGGGSA